ncbi:MAG TPA: hypothetical protein PL082_02195 [Tepidiformaceae bacterium]|nr:hypothetical protein [Tepidiformaceae bacterium]
MYAIRVAPRNLLLVTLNGTMSTEEALRAVSQTAALAGAGSIGLVLCDLRGLERRPGGLGLIAASVLKASPAGWRMALVARPDQAAVAARFGRMSARRGEAAVFAGSDSAIRWLAEVERRRISETEARHYRELTKQWQEAPANGEPAVARKTGAA